MTETQAFFVDIINLVPDNSICYVQAPSLENSELLALLSESPYKYYKQVILSPSNKSLFCKIVSKEGVEIYFQSIEIKFNNDLLFKGYDGMDYGTISKRIELPAEFVNTHFPKEMYNVSQDW